MKWREILIEYYLNIKTFILNWYVYLKSMIIEINKVHIINNYGDIQNVFLRYMAIKILVFIKNICEQLITFIIYKIDVEAKKVHIIKENVEGEKTIIIDSQLNFQKDNMSLEDIINYINNNNYVNSNISSTKIFLTFELQNSTDKICLKEYNVKYKDNEKIYGHTLKNIFEFNNITINENESYINIAYFKKGKRVTHIIPYSECNNTHITDFYNIE